jgi:CarD family transcriptional regulator
MFRENDYVMYASAGVCKVQKIDYPDFIKEKNRKYYFLKPVHSFCDSIFVPVDNGSKMRRVLTRKEAEELISQIPQIETQWIDEEAAREEEYKKAIQSFDCYELVKMVKSLYLKMAERKKEGKKPLQTDEKYMDMAESYLHGELAVALDMPIDNVRQYIESKVSESKKNV